MPPQNPTPNQYPQYPQTPQSNNGQYDFIMAPQQPKRPSPFGSPKQLFVLIGGAIGLIVVIVVLISLLSGGKSDSQPFVELAQSQQEIFRVADMSGGDATSQSVQNFAVTSKLTMTSDEAKLLAYLNKNGVKVPAKQLALGQDSAHDTALENAKNTSSTNTVLQQILTDELTTYQTKLKQLFEKTTNPDTRTLLNHFYTNAGLLLQQSKQ